MNEIKFVRKPCLQQSIKYPVKVMKGKEYGCTVHIFSDESGSWSNEEVGLYIRSFVYIQEELLEQKKKDINAVLKKINVNKKMKVEKELKWKCIKKYPILADKLFQNTHVFTSFHSLKDTLSRNNKLDTFLQGSEAYRLIPNSFNHDAPPEFTESYINRLVSSSNNLYFLYFDETSHLQNALCVGKQYYPKGNMQLTVDYPQVNNKSFKEVAELLGFQNTQTVESEKHAGIQLADIAAGCLREIITCQRDGRQPSKTSKAWFDNLKKYFHQSGQEKNTRAMFNPRQLYYKDSQEQITIDGRWMYIQYN